MSTFESLTLLRSRVEKIETRLDKIERDLSVPLRLSPFRAEAGIASGPGSQDDRYKHLYDLQHIRNLQTRIATTTCEEPYEYKPLDMANEEIRLLLLFDSAEQPVELAGALTHVSLNQIGNAKDEQNWSDVHGWVQQLEHRYNALSYAWGETNLNQSIVIEGKRLQITSNLAKALRKLQKRKVHSDLKFSVWWIDQICINQSDIHERNQQVSLMRRIYKKARNVIVWLGDETYWTLHAMKLLHEIGASNKRAPGEKSPHYPDLSPVEVMHNRLALCDFFNQPWWERAWIRQEVAMGKRGRVIFLWGDTQCTLEDAKRTVMALEHVESLKPNIDTSAIWWPDRAELFCHSHPMSINMLCDASHYGENFIPLAELLRHSRQTKATDLRDKVFSVLGLDNPEIHGISADYSKPVRYILFETTSKLLRRKADLALHLLEACQNPERLHHLPSWVPNLIDDWKYFPFPDQVWEPHGLRSGWDPRQTVSIRGTVLTIKGYHVDTVGTIASQSIGRCATAAEIDMICKEWKRFIETKAKEFKGHKWFWKSDNARVEQLKHLEVWLPRQLGPPYISDAFEQLRISSLNEQINVKLARTYLHGKGWEPDKMVKLRTMMQNYGVNRRLGFTAKRKVPGLFPSDVEEGDDIVRFYGLKYSYVLRKAIGKEGYYLVGDACCNETYGDWKEMIGGERIEEEFMLR